MSKPKRAPETPLEAARRRFHECVDASGGCLKAADELGISPSAVSLVYNEKRDISDVSTARRIEEKWGIPMRDWAIPAEPETVKRFAR